MPTSSASGASSAGAKTSQPGLQHTQKTGVVVTVYPVADHGITQKSGDVKTYGPVTFDGNSALSARPSVVACTTTNALQSGGSFVVTVKAGVYGPLIENLSDDSWVDISFTNNGKTWHVMRGLVDEVRQSESIAGAGAYVATHTLIGRSFQKIWAATPYWFNPNSYEDIAGTFIYQLLSTVAGAAPEKIIEAYLRGVLAVLGRYKRGVWAMPPQMPGTQKDFVASFDYNIGNYNFYGLPLTMAAASVLQTTGTGDLWSIAQQFSDPLFTELFTEQALYVGKKLYIDQDGTHGAPIADTAMTVVFRDKPFLTVDPILGADKIARKGPFFNLPTFVLPRQAIETTDLGVSGYERYNAFFTTPPVQVGETQANFEFYKTPLWFPQDMSKHGFRRMDITSSYTPDGPRFANYGKDLNIDMFSHRRRALIRDWYCMGGILRSGTLSLGCGAPHLKVGCRLRILPSATHNEQSFYIESVSHQWSMPQGMRTQVAVTRGFLGTDDQLIAQLSQISQSYEEAASIAGA